MSKRRRQPQKIDIDSNKLWRAHSKLSRREISTGDVSDMLEAHAGERPSTKDYIQLPLPVPLKNKKLLCLYLRVFSHLRSPSWPVRKRFVAIAEPEIILRCIEHIAGLADLHRHAPARGHDWQVYLEDALAALKPRETPELVPWED